MKRFFCRFWYSSFDGNLVEHEVEAEECKRGGAVPPDRTRGSPVCVKLRMSTLVAGVAGLQGLHAGGAYPASARQALEHVQVPYSEVTLAATETATRSNILCKRVASRAHHTRPRAGRGRGIQLGRRRATRPDPRVPRLRPTAQGLLVHVEDYRLVARIALVVSTAATRVQVDVSRDHLVAACAAVASFRRAPPNQLMPSGATRN